MSDSAKDDLDDISEVVQVETENNHEKPEINEEEEDTFVSLPTEILPESSTIERLSRLLESTKEQKATLLNLNATIQKKIIPILLKKNEAKDDLNDVSKLKNTENEKRYLDCVNTVRDAKTQLQKARVQYDRIAVDLQTRLDEKDHKANDIQESFTEFKREIAKSAENSRTAKPIPTHMIDSLDAATVLKDQEVEKVRLKNINLRNQLNKLEGALRTKEQLAEGLHLIDFEQLKIENQTLNEKIEERNEELTKLRTKTTDTVQVLTHLKEKTQFIQVQNTSLRQTLGGLDAHVTDMREVLTKSKKKRDGIRTGVAVLKQKQGFANSDLLVQDYETRNETLVTLQKRKNTLTERLYHLSLMLSSTG